MKLGLANIIILLIIYSKDIKGAYIVAVSKSLIGTFVTGTLFSPTVILSLGSTVFATSLMLFFSSNQFSFSILGISVIGAVSHNLAQLFFVRMLFIKANDIFNLTPLLILLGIGSGLITGYLAYYVFKKLNNPIKKTE